MRHVTRKGLMTVAAATGVIAAAGGQAHADAHAGGSAANSPGVLSGNTVQVPVNIGVDVCGNTVNVVGLLNPAAGNGCAIGGGHGSGKHDGGKHDGGKHGGGKHRGGHDGHGGAHADGRSSGSPGVGSGNTVQVPVDVPVNVCGNSVDVVGLGNAAVGNDCVNEGTGRHRKPPATPERPDEPGKPGKPDTPDTPGKPGKPGKPGTPDRPDTPGSPATPDTPGGPAPHGGTPPQLAETGAGVPAGAVLPIGAGALLAGVMLFRRARAAV
ncbi:chaplin [Streptomyces fragilis]|uniref:Chaplin family protein n=1 Tax=Streptomyces fragilis TaxID=67301 RepID=A0ABV2YPA8_9ACTN|nr:chaplin family protein [Streptomyces fragilis]